MLFHGQGRGLFFLTQKDDPNCFYGKDAIVYLALFQLALAIYKDILSVSACKPLLCVVTGETEQNLLPHPTAAG